jgi:hypothetical protein
MKKTSSIHSLNSDNGLSMLNRIIWLIINFLNNLFSKVKIDSGLRLKNAREFEIGKFFFSNAQLYSPARYVSNKFWSSLPWADISSILNKEVNALEVGCGSGEYGRLIKKYLGSHLKKYLGIDVYENDSWMNYHNDDVFKFQAGDAKSISPFLKGKNLIITQSALEHFDEDLTFFKQISNYVDKVSYPVIQIHLMPSSSCLYTFLWHGIRQYTPRTISKITKLFGVNTFKTLYSLGGPKCNKVHRKYITYPIIFRRGDQRYINKNEYNQELKTAIEYDLKNVKRNQESFYALLLQSNTTSDFTIKTSV